MASDRHYLEFIMDQLSSLGGVTYRAMMGEFIIYLDGRIVGGIYDDRFLVKVTESSERLMPGAPREAPYDGAKEMILVENVDESDFLCALLCAMYPELPEPKKAKYKKPEATS